MSTELNDQRNYQMNPVFIGGTGRCGTTILKRVLTKHSKVVALPDELRIIVDPGGALNLISSLTDYWSPYLADFALQEFLSLLSDSGRAKSRLAIYFEKAERKLFRLIGVSPRRYLGQGIGYYFGNRAISNQISQLMEKLGCEISHGSWIGSPPFRVRSKIYECGPTTRQSAESSLREFFQNLYKNLARNGENYWVDDTPSNLLYAAELLALFPNMKLIHIYRDPRDVLVSYLGFSWGGNSVEAAANRLIGIYSRWYEIRNKLPKSFYVEISLEELAKSPKQIMLELCQFIDLDFEAEMLTVNLDRANSGRWKNELIDWKLVKERLLPYISQLGYEVEFEK